ncbi:uncharacterized protein LAESUDRAFT_672451 [Laetiporus sulphureus 93-53]|uniref:Vacuolar sorting protein Vps3844 C-terminal domain-containing protein n=1 Tax=Laetiporus sulphureus 93-53 TaxID=1314785 RepID=A0A165GVP0_9APHY|nr:uncharacterized protein LAESUDRAFT_672451 [Laetiporus sulphureus 93-53]KZT10884.1 hypothetical protein LAESUDRAFT_672451 [Laetiporus sulphureus 93-53]
MKGLSICLLLAGVSQAVRVYLNPPVSLPSQLSAQQAGAALSRHLGLDYYESLDDWELFAGSSKQEAFVGQGPGSALLLSIDEEDAVGVIPSSFKESFSLSDEPSPSSLATLIPTYLDRAHHSYSHIFSHSQLPTEAPRIIDIFSVPSSASQTFLEEMTTIVGFLESDDIPNDKFAAVELRGLAELAAEFGRDSEQYRLASETIRGLLSSAIEKRGLKLALVTVPVSAFQAKRQELQPPQSPFPPPMPGPAEPIDAVATCYTTATACGNATNACSSHGECVEASKAGRTCFVCACAATTDDRGRTELWAGNACERKDVSGPFTLIAGTVVALILLVGGSIALLSTIGDQELPNTLTGGIVPTTRKD